MNKYELILIAVLGWFSPLIPFFLITGVIISWDTFFGVKLAQKQKSFNSRKFARFLYKFLIYNVVIATTYYLDTNLIGEFINSYIEKDMALTKIIMIGIVIVELMSIDEKMRMIDNKGFKYYYLKIKNIIKFLNQERKEIIDDGNETVK